MLSFDSIEDRVMAAGIAGILAIALELLADFGPPAVVWLWWPKARREETAADPVAVILEPAPCAPRSPKSARNDAKKLITAPKKTPKKPEKLVVDNSPQAEKRHVLEWAAKACVRDDSAETQAASLHGDFAAWCQVRHLTPMHIGTFGGILKGELALSGEKRGGLVRYKVRLVSAGKTLTVVAG
jgi:hypothetical protein